jgi:hypothetical protein
LADVQDKTHELFTRAGLADDDLGYPDRVSFLPVDARRPPPAWPHARAGARGLKE